MTDTDRIQINEARIRAEFDELARIDSERHADPAVRAYGHGRAGNRKEAGFS